MQLLPDREQAKPLAIGLALLTLVLIYLLCFHWLVMRHLDYSEQIDELTERLSKYRSAVLQQPQLVEQLTALRSRSQNQTLFLAGTNLNTAAADLTQRLKQVISAQADQLSACQVVSNQNVQAREQERFDKVLVKVRMRCNLEDFVKVMHELQNTMPLVFVDEVNIYQRRVPIPGRPDAGDTSELDIRFDMFGYLAVETEVEEQA